MKYPIGIQNFEKIRKDGYLYVDKTALIYRLVTEGSYYFLSRPRRFGKSLLISTLEAYYQGKKELFEGLDIEKLEKDWTVRPVLHLDLNARRYQNAEDLRNELNRHLEGWEKTYGDQYKDRSLEERFSHLIEMAAEQSGQRVVILVDEYDKPLLQSINNESLQDEFRSTLKAFFGVMKSMDGYIQLGLLTGVTKFSKVSIFSDLNNLRDISTNKSYHNLCGITEQEVHSNFDYEIGVMADANSISKDECYAKLKEYYDGYHFCQNSDGLYNPFSLLNALSDSNFGSYWFETGTPTILVEKMKATGYPLEGLSSCEVDGGLMSSLDSFVGNPIPLMYQSGYLTIKGYDEEFHTYQLGFPNKEVEVGLTDFLLPYYTSFEPGSHPFVVTAFVKDLRNGEAEQFMQRLQAFFADGDYRLEGKKELYFHNAVYIIFKMLGFYVEVERATSEGRMDMIIQTKDYIYILEFKIDKSAKEAIQQIEDKHYAAPFATDSRKIIKIGVNFSSETGGINDWLING